VTELKLLELLARIREAVGDPDGRLMQDELVERCRALYVDRRLEAVRDAGNLDHSRQTDGGIPERALTADDTRL
jgi:hypothetical protein